MNPFIVTLMFARPFSNRLGVRPVRTIEHLLREVAHRHRLSVTQVRAERRNSRSSFGQLLVDARGEAFHLANAELGMSMNQIALYMGMAHTTVMRCVQRHRARQTQVAA